ncbi:unnamed protein product [Urochloa humidicola]
MPLSSTKNSLRGAGKGGGEMTVPVWLRRSNAASRYLVTRPTIITASRFFAGGHHAELQSGVCRTMEGMQGSNGQGWCLLHTSMIHDADSPFSQAECE